jgi:mRNA interferase MazF
VIVPAVIVPRQWHLYVVDLEPRVGTKPGKQRPCVAVQPTAFADAGLTSTVILPLTTSVVADAFPLRVRIPSGTCGLARDSDALVDQILAWHNELFRRDLGLLPEALQERLRDAMREFLDL